MFFPVEVWMIATIFLHPISGVVSTGSKKEMLRVTASLIITMVTYTHPFWYRAIG